MDWVALRRMAAGEVYILQTSSSYQAQLTAISVILGVSLLLGLISVLLRVRHGDFWTTDGQWYWEPHGIHPFLLISIVFLGAAQHFVDSSRQSTVIGTDLHNFLLYRTYIWPILWIAGYFVAWAQYIASLELEDHLRKRPSARVVNLVFLSIPLIFGAILIPLTVIANQHSNAAFDDWRLLDGLLATAAENAAAGKTVDIFSIEAVKLALERESTLAVMYWRQFWSWSTSSLVVSMAIFAFAWKSYARSLSHSMTVLQLQRAAGSTFLSHFRAVKVEYRSLFATAITFTLVHVLYIADGVWLALKTYDIATGVRGVGVYAIFISLYIYTVLGFLAHVVILVRSIDWNYVNDSKKSATQVTTVNLQVGKKPSANSFKLDEIHTSHEAVRSYDTDRKYSAHDIELQAVAEKGERPFA